MSLRSARRNQTPNNITKGLENLRQDRRGVSAIEFAVIAPIMVILMLGAFDLGNALQQQIYLQQAVRAGGQYAMSFPYTTSGTLNTAGIINAINGALPSGWTNVTTPTPTSSCSCWNNGTTTACAVDPNPPCASGIMVERFITISASRPYSGTGYLSAALGTNTASYVARFQ